MIGQEEMVRRVAEEPDFVAVRRFEYSLEKLSARYPDGCPDHLIAAALLKTEDEVEALYRSAVEHLRDVLGVGSERA